MKPRVTLCLRSDGSFELLCNEAGRDLLVENLQSLDRRNDHPAPPPGGIQLSQQHEVVKVRMLAQPSRLSLSQLPIVQVQRIHMVRDQKPRPLPLCLRYSGHGMRRPSIMTRPCNVDE